MWTVQLHFFWKHKVLFSETKYPVPTSQDPKIWQTSYWQRTRRRVIVKPKKKNDVNKQKRRCARLYYNLIFNTFCFAMYIWLFASTHAVVLLFIWLILSLLLHWGSWWYVFMCVRARVFVVLFFFFGKKVCIPYLYLVCICVPNLLCSAITWSDDNEFISSVHTTTHTTHQFVPCLKIHCVKMKIWHYSNQLFPPKYVMLY